MASNHLPNHLRTHRKRSALSQDDVAFLLGTKGGEKICRHERFVCEPELEAVLAYEIIFQKPARELLAGLYRKIEHRVLERARVLVHKTKRQKQGSLTRRKSQALAAIIARLTSKT